MSTKKEEELYDKWFPFFLQYRPVNWKFEYQHPENLKAVDDKLRKRWIDKCLTLLDIFEKDEANDDEMYRFTKFCAVVLDAEKHRLSINKAYNDLHIDEIVRDYYISKGE